VIVDLPKIGDVPVATTLVEAPAKARDETHVAPIRGPRLRAGRYAARLAEIESDRLAAYRLRFHVFNLELNEGLKPAYTTGLDCDEFDPFCDHILVEDMLAGGVVGTYRLQSGAMAARNRGYYSAQEFDFSPYESLRDFMLELGRACVHRSHRSMEVLTLLWRAIAQYAQERRLRYLIGCSSLSSQDTDTGSAAYQRLQDYLVGPLLRTVPLADHSFVLSESQSRAEIPRLLRAYLAMGAQICGPPALDREFGTIDFLTLLDLECLSPIVRARFLR
jgi:putative hemolysin